MLNLAQAIGMSPETYESNWPLFYKLYLAMNKNEGELLKRLYKPTLASAFYHSGYQYFFRPKGDS